LGTKQNETDLSSSVRHLVNLVEHIKNELLAAAFSVPLIKHKDRILKGIYLIFKFKQRKYIDLFLQKSNIN